MNLASCILLNPVPQNRMATATEASKFQENLGITAKEWPAFEAAIQQCKLKANILITGLTGAGKSTVINALCGAVPQDSCSGGDIQLPAKEGHTLEHETTIPVSYPISVTTESVEELFYDTQGCVSDWTSRDFTVNIWDSPGIHDGTGNERGYLLNVRSQCDYSIDVFLYCIDISKQRCIKEEMVPGMQIVTEVFGADIWKYSVIVLTFANLVEPKSKSASEDDKCHHFLRSIHHWEGKVREALVEGGAPDEIAQKIPVEPAGHYSSPHLPDRIHWLGYLWLVVVKRARMSAKIPILAISQNHVRNADFLSPYDEELLEGISRPEIIIDKKAHAKVLDTLLRPIRELIERMTKIRKQKKNPSSTTAE